MPVMKKNNSFLYLIAAFSLLVTLYCQFPLLTNKFAIDDDVRQEIYHYERYRDKDLFKDDLIVTDYLKKWNPIGLNSFYYLISKIYDPVQFTKILPFFLCLFSVIYMYLIGRTLRNGSAGLLSGLMFIFLAWSRKDFAAFSTGNGEDFGILFCIMFIYYFLKKDSLKTGISLVLLALFYPPLLIICLLTCIFCLVFEFSRSGIIKKKDLIILASVLFIVLVTLIIEYGDGKIKMLSLKEMRNMQEFYPWGRKPLFFASFYRRWTNAESGIALDYPVAWLAVVSFLLFLFRRKKALANLPCSLWYFIFISFIMFIIANIVMFRLYGPSRFLRYPLPLFLIFFVAVNISDIINSIKSVRRKSVFLLGFIFLTMLCFVPKLKARYRIAPYPSLYAFLQTLPKNALIAGEPFLMDDIPTFAKRKVLMDDEVSQPYFADFYPLIKERIFDFFGAYYSDSYEKVCDFCRKYEVTYLVVNKKHFSPDYLTGKFIYYNPFNGYIKNLIKDRPVLLLANIPEEKKIFTDADIFALKVEDICKEK